MDTSEPTGAPRDERPGRPDRDVASPQGWSPRALLRRRGLGYLLCGLAFFLLVGLGPLVVIVVQGLGFVLTFGGVEPPKAGAFFSLAFGALGLALGHFMYATTRRLAALEQAASASRTDAEVPGPDPRR